MGRKKEKPIKIHIPTLNLLIELRKKCPKCGGVMVPKADGAKMFKITGFQCIKCLYIINLSKPIPDPSLQAIGRTGALGME
jgi:tRNA(Ile2) C34 agmatinyltransferase TiaS